MLLDCLTVLMFKWYLKTWLTEYQCEDHLPFSYLLVLSNTMHSSRQDSSVEFQGIFCNNNILLLLYFVKHCYGLCWNENVEQKWTLFVPRKLVQPYNRTLYGRTCKRYHLQKYSEVSSPNIAEQYTPILNRLSSTQKCKYMNRGVFHKELRLMLHLISMIKCCTNQTS